MEPKKFSYLRSLRLSRNLTTQQLARNLGIHPSNITHIEYRKRNCGEMMARRLAAFFKDDWEKFLSRKEK